jgi:hypothetical protein
MLALTLFLGGCTTAPPANPDNLCSIFREKERWYRDAAKARKTWDSPIPVMMAIMHQESRFVARAKPPRKRILWVIPGPRPSDAYGYSQALGSTWRAYQRSAGRYGADRNDFGDAIDFIGWYNHQSTQRNGIAPGDARKLYLAYHEGHGGYSRGSWRSKGWLQEVAARVEGRARRYRGQLASCEDELKRGRGFFGRLF